MIFANIIYSITRLDVCESKVEVTSPFWASNSNGKVMIMMIMISNSDDSNDDDCQGARHPQQQGVRAGGPPGDLHVCPVVQ